MIFGLADRQWGVVARRQLVRSGISPEVVKSRVHGGFMFTVNRGVYYLGRGPMDQRAIWMAAVLATGDSSLLCGRSAAVLHDFMDREMVIDVRCEVSRRRYNTTIIPPVGRNRAVHIRRLRGSEALNSGQIQGIPVVGAAVALLQLAEELSLPGLKNAYLTADMKGLLTEFDLAWLVTPKPGHKGAGRLRALVLRRNPQVREARSVLEARFIELCEQAGFPRPEVNATVEGYVVDFWWAELRLIVEVDGAAFHRGAAKLADDRHRENVLVAAGNAVLRFNWNQIVNEPSVVVAQLREVKRQRMTDNGPFFSR